MTRPDLATGRQPSPRPAWRPVLDAPATSVALGIALEVGRRLTDQDLVDGAVRRARALVDEPRLVRWRPDGLWQGYAGLALLSAVLDRLEPDGAWDIAGRDQIRSAVSGLEVRTNRGESFVAAVRGLAAAAHALSRGETRYQTLTARLDSALAELASARARAIIHAAPHGVSVSTFDVISGLTGTGRQLLESADRTRDALVEVLSALVALSASGVDDTPHWYTPPTAMSGGFLPAVYPSGHVNLGLAHGVPGPLALMSLATTAGVEVPGQRDAIQRTAEAVAGTQLSDEWGVTFPIVDGCPSPSPGRNAWCYGSPGIARALWLAGTAVGRDDLRDLGIEAMLAVGRRPAAVRRIDSPTLCHGIAGLLMITSRFAVDTGRIEFSASATGLVDQLITEFDPASTFGYRNLEPSGSRIDHPGLLDGAAGVALALLAAATSVEPWWDQVLLLS